MDCGAALTEAMKEANLRDEEVAVKTGVSAAMVAKWRRNRGTPSGLAWQKLRDLVPGFADRIDAQSKASVVA